MLKEDYVKCVTFKIYKLFNNSSVSNNNDKANKMCGKIVLLPLLLSRYIFKLG